MGKKGDPMAVMPAVLGGHTPMAAYRIGEKCAGSIKENRRMVNWEFLPSYLRRDGCRINAFYLLFTLSEGTIGREES